jgi:tRNA(fMet)-specific endonuclease VapC
MAARYLLDTNTASYVIRGNFPRLRERLLRTSSGEVAISAVTEGEMRFGVARKPDATRLKLAVNEILLRVEILPWDSEAARAYGLLRALLEKRGQPMGNLDLMIAAHALSADIPLVSHDRSFLRVPSLRVQDWTTS